MKRQLRSTSRRQALEERQMKSLEPVAAPPPVQNGRKRGRSSSSRAVASPVAVKELPPAEPDLQLDSNNNLNQNGNIEHDEHEEEEEDEIVDHQTEENSEAESTYSILVGPDDSSSSQSSTSGGGGGGSGSSKRLRKEYKCEVCEKQFQGLNDLRKHLRIHSDERPYPCTQCSKRFRQAGCLKNHIASQHGTDELFVCEFCNKSFPIKERLRLHLRVHTGEKPYKCNLCNKEFARGGQLTQHRLSHNGEKNYRCTHCTGAFTCAANLKLHLKSHKNERDYTCHKCGKSFLRPDALTKHLNCFHDNVKAFHCPVCNKMFKGHLPQHMRIHNKLKPHGCADCGTTFTQRSQLVVHQRIHSGERPYRCQVCWQAFAHSSVLKLHIRKHTGEKPFKCRLCTETMTAFSQLPHLKKHMQSIHKQSKPYLCEGCHEFFKTKVEHQAHMAACAKCKERGMEEDPDGVDQRDSDMPMSLSKMRLLVAVLLKKISKEERLKALGYEKRLIDHVLIDSLKAGKRLACEDKSLAEGERLKVNIRELLEWTVPPNVMDEFRSQHRSTEELLEELTN